MVLPNALVVTDRSLTRSRLGQEADYRY